jgi:hypothetical protein
MLLSSLTAVFLAAALPAAQTTPSATASHDTPAESLAGEASPPPVPAALEIPLSPSSDPHHVVFQASVDEGVGVGTADGNYSVHLGFVGQLLVDERLSPGVLGTPSFNVRVIRPNLHGNLFKKWIRFFIQPELANTPRLLDAQLDVQPWDEFGVRVGQFLTPFSRAFLTPLPLLEFQDYSASNVFFRADRQTGAMLFGTPWAGRFEYYAGIFNGNGVNQGGDDDRRAMFMGRVAYNPFGAVPYVETELLSAPTTPKLALALNVYENHVQGVRQVTYGGDVALHWRALTVQVELYRRHQGNPGESAIDSWGATFQAGYLFFGHLELAERVSLLYPEMGQSGFQSISYQTQLCYYILGHHLKAALRHVYTDSGDRAVVATPGVSQSLQLALQTAF